MKNRIQIFVMKKKKIIKFLLKIPISNIDSILKNLFNNEKQNSNIFYEKNIINFLLKNFDFKNRFVYEKSIQ